MKEMVIGITDKSNKNKSKIEYNEMRLSMVKFNTKIKFNDQ